MLGKDGASSKPDCPYCGSQNIIRYGHKCNKQRFLCRDCGRTFTTTTHTVMFNSHFSPEVWADVIEDTLRGNSIGYTAKRLGLYHQATFAMRHKILIPLQQMPEIGNICLGEVSELDETFILDCYTSKPLDDDISRKPRKHGAKLKSAAFPANMSASAVAYSAMEMPMQLRLTGQNRMRKNFGLFLSVILLTQH